MRMSAVVRSATVCLLAAALAAAPIPATAATRTVEAGTGGDRVFSPRSITIARGDRVRWDSVSGSHDVTSRLAGYFRANGQLAADGQYARTFRAAGSFGYFCMFHSGMTGSVVVPIAVSLSGGLFTIRVASASSSGTRWRNRIQVRKPGSSTWRTITTTTRTSVTYDPGPRGTYRFRSAVIDSGTGDRSGFSPVVSKQY
jgi:plastocyanin